MFSWNLSSNEKGIVVFELKRREISGRAVEKKDLGLSLNECRSQFRCCNKTPEIGYLINSRNVFLTFLEAGGLRSGC